MARTIGLAIAYIAIGLTGGFAVAWMWSGSDASTASVGSFADRDSGSRIEILERQLATMTDTRDALGREINALREDVDDLSQLVAAITENDDFVAESSIAYESADSSTAENAPSIGRFVRDRRTRVDQVTLLTEAGFSNAQAENIKRRVEELRVSAMEARFDLQRNGGSATAGAARQLLDTEAVLRQELGDPDYERYLSALGRPTSVNIDTVLASSAAERAGLQIGDEIVNYGGERVFNVRDLNQVLLTGQPGETVLVDIVRDDIPMQIAIPRGPLGISSNFGGRSLR